MSDLHKVKMTSRLTITDFSWFKPKWVR